MIRWLWTQEKEWFDRWDKFNSASLRGNWSQYTDWLSTYRYSGFETELLLGIENDEICIGYCIVKKAKFVFNFYILNYGPIVKEGYENYVEESICLFLEKAKQEKACYCHINLPVVKDGHSRFCLPKDTISWHSKYYSGKACTFFPIEYIASRNGHSWISLPDVSEEERLAQFNPYKRRDIRASLRKGLKIVEAKTAEQVREAYHFCEFNSREKGFEMRPWKVMKHSLLRLFEKGYLECSMAFKDAKCKGATIVMKFDNNYYYLFGGAKREKPDLLVGTFLQWHIIKKSMRAKMPVYDISDGGTKGVKRFKNSFDPSSVEFIDGRYWIFSPVKFKLYKIFLPFIKRNRQIIAAVFSFFY